MRALLLSACLLLSVLLFAPEAAADGHCVVDANGAAGVACVYMNVAFCAAYVGDDHLVCNSQLERVCLVNTDGVCIYR